METKAMGLGGRFEILDELYLTFFILLKTCGRKLLSDYTFFLILKTFDPKNVHNMFAIMLDPHFKSLWVTKNYVGCEESICVAFEYDVKTMIPLLMTCFD